MLLAILQGTGQPPPRSHPQQGLIGLKLSVTLLLGSPAFKMAQRETKYQGLQNISHSLPFSKKSKDQKRPAVEMLPEDGAGTVSRACDCQSTSRARLLWRKQSAAAAKTLSDSPISGL